MAEINENVAEVDEELEPTEDVVEESGDVVDDPEPDVVPHDNPDLSPRLTEIETRIQDILGRISMVERSITASRLVTEAEDVSEGSDAGGIDSLFEEVED